MVSRGLRWLCTLALDVFAAIFIAVAILARLSKKDVLASHTDRLADKDALDHSGGYIILALMFLLIAAWVRPRRKQKKDKQNEGQSMSEALPNIERNEGEKKK
jgi:uncharacterized membrane protein